MPFDWSIDRQNLAGTVIDCSQESITNPYIWLIWYINWRSSIATELYVSITTTTTTTTTTTITVSNDLNRTKLGSNLNRQTRIC